MARDLRVMSIPDADPVVYFVIDRLTRKQIAGPFADAGQASETIRANRQAGDRAICPKCRAALVFVSNRGLWACDAGTRRRHSCFDDRRRS